MLLTLLLLACGDPEPAAPPPEVAPPPSVEASPAAPPAAPPPGALVDADAHAALGGQYLVIVHTGAPREATPPKLAALPGLQRLDSSRFKNLMPCYEILIAGASPTLSGAKEIAKGLGGVDHYIKAAGDHVGTYSRLEALCQDETPSACDEAPRMAVGVGGQAHLALNLEGPIAARALEGVGAPTRVEGHHTWRAPLPAKTLGEVSVGDAWSLVEVSAGERRSCTVSGFAALTRGQPHFGWVDANPEPKAPGCGEPVPYATLDCDGPVDGDRWLAARPDQPLVVYTASDEPPELEGEFGAVMLNAAGHLLEEAEAWGEEEGAPVHSDGATTLWTAEGAPALVTVRLDVMTGDGESECGGPDYSAQRYGVWLDDNPGQAVLYVHDLGSRTPFGLARYGDRVYSLELSWSGEMKLVGPDGEDACALPFEFCDCAC